MMAAHFKILSTVWTCIVEILRWREVAIAKKLFLKESMKQKWNFQRGGGYQSKNPWGYGYGIIPCKFIKIIVIILLLLYYHI